MHEHYRFKAGQFKGNHIRTNYTLLIDYGNSKANAGIKAVLAKHIPVDLDPKLTWAYALWGMILRWTDYGRRQ